MNGPGAESKQGLSIRAEILLLGLILFAGLLLRLYQVTSPPVDFLSWRDTQTLMVARNFFRDGMNLFSPSVDWRTTANFAARGTVGGTELQVVPYLTAALYFIFGIQYWVGRVVPIIFALLGTAYFHFLVRRFYGSACALLSALLLTASPYYLYCGRVQMPEPFAYAMSFAALYYFDVWLESKDGRRVFTAALFTALMLLGKPQLVIVAVPMAFVAFRRHGVRTFATPGLYVFTGMVAIPVCAYMVYSYVVLIPVAGLSFAQGSLLDYRQYLGDPHYYAEVVKAALGTALTVPVAVLAGLGIAVRVKETREYFAHAWLLGAVSFFFLMPGGNIANGYYHLVLAPPAVILAARALTRAMRTRVLTFAVALAAVAVSAYCLYVAKGFFVPYYAGAQHCGEWIAANTPKETRILTASKNPATLYFADRAGWTAWRETFNMGLVEKVRPLGGRVVAVSEEWFDNAYYPQYQGIRDELYDRFFCFHGGDFAVFYVDTPAELALPDGGQIAFGTPESRKYLRGTWGPNQVGSTNAGFVAMGPGKKAFVVFTSAGPVSGILVELSSAVANQELSFELNGKKTGQLSISQPLERGVAKIDGVAEATPNGRWLLSIEASRQNENAASLLLYSMRVQQ